MNRRGISRRVLAQHHVDHQMDEAACKYQRPLWDEAEAAHAAARTREEAAAAAAPAMGLCAGCPIRDICEAWAIADEYTGLAAGSAWIDGSRREAGWVRMPAA